MGGYDGSNSAYSNYMPARTSSFGSRDRAPTFTRQPSIVPHTTPSSANMEDAPDASASQNVLPPIETDENAAPAPEVTRPYDEEIDGLGFDEDD